MRLIDCRTGEVVAESHMTREPDEPNWYTYEGMTGNGAAGLRKESRLSGEEAEDHYKTLLKL